MIIFSRIINVYVTVYKMIEDAYLVAALQHSLPAMHDQCVGCCNSAAVIRRKAIMLPCG
jgi:hypothetical protein